MEWLKIDQWSPYSVGMGIGVLNCIAFLISDRFIGCSGAFVRMSGMFERFVRGKKVCDKPYYQKFPITIDWEWLLVIIM